MREVSYIIVGGDGEGETYHDGGVFYPDPFRNHIIFLIETVLSFAKAVGNISTAVQDLCALRSDRGMYGWA